MTDANPARLNAALEGRYAIERELGEGGMATVYLADDLKHRRKVALKVLKPALAAVVGAERFIAEIRTTANLQHPHILPLFDSGEADSFLYYVMPYVEGESLKDRLDREKQLGVQDALAITQKVADALDYAHDQGVVHRDIKPGNILLSERGEPLIADFGIALAVAQAGGGRITETGLSLGTPHYMSPEQATGDRDVDPRSDVYALGCVLYEMLSGQPPFSASTGQAVLVQILTTDPQPVATVRRTVPPHVDSALARALEKLPADRFESAADFAAALRDESFTYSRVTRAEPVATTADPVVLARPGTIDRRAFNAASALAVAALGLAAWGWLRPAPSPEPGVPTRARLTGLEMRVPGTGGTRLAISQDGRWMAVGDIEGQTSHLFVRPAEDPEWRRLPNTEGGTSPSFSPDGEWLAFSQDRTTISKVSIRGGPALPIATGDEPHWGLDETIVFNRGDALYSVSASGGEPELLFESDTVGVSRPHLLPNGEAVVFGTANNALTSRILLLEIESGDVRELLPSGNQPHYVPTGHLVFGHGNGALLGISFDLETLQTTGTQVTLLPSLNVFSGGASQFGVSRTGTLIYDRSQSTADFGTRFVEVDRDGVETPLPLATGTLLHPRYSPDGGKIAYQDGDEIRIYDVVTGASPQFTSEGGLFPAWSSDGEYLSFASGAFGALVAYRRPADGREPATPIWDEAAARFVADIGPGDSISVVQAFGAERAADLLLMRGRAEDAEFEDFLTAEWDETNPSVSPDGQWIAYQSDESGEPRIYVHSFPSITGRRSISPGMGTDPVWSPDRRQIYYRSGSRFLAVDITTEPGFEVSVPDLLFEEPLYGFNPFFGNVRNWDVHPDGSRFLMVTVSTGQGTAGLRLNEVYVVTNWFEELKQRMGN